MPTDQYLEVYVSGQKDNVDSYTGGRVSTIN